MAKVANGFFTPTGQALETLLWRFLKEQEPWIVSCRGTVTFKVVGKPWAEAIVCATVGAEPNEQDQVFRAALNQRLVAAGFKTNLPEFDRHADGHLLLDRPTFGIEILGFEG